ncbi:MAG: GFA family protein [Betaproteobacteria bacterium]|nr:MAG: GFA family protein [Betaproteobacteria bacterium]
MRIDGGCHCGYLAYEAEIDPAQVRVCHCTDCQIFSGSAYSTFVAAARGSFRLLAGEPAVYVKTAESGNRRAQAFCPHCGTRIHASAEIEPQWFNLRVGTIRQRAELRPSVQIWCRSALPWAMDLASMEPFARQPAA